MPLCSTYSSPAKDPPEGWPTAAGQCPLLAGLHEGHLGQGSGTWRVGCSKFNATVPSLLCGKDSLHGVDTGLTAVWGRTAACSGGCWLSVPGSTVCRSPMSLASRPRVHKPLDQPRATPSGTVPLVSPNTGLAVPAHPGLQDRHWHGPLTPGLPSPLLGVWAWRAQPRRRASPRPCCLPSPGPQPSSPVPKTTRRHTGQRRRLRKGPAEAAWAGVGVSPAPSHMQI